jgi:4-hydroxy-tetrahydrodipicolinate synthase
MVGISAHSTVMAAEQIERAHRLGADSAMVFLPQYFKLTFEDVRRHYSHLAANSPLPIFYYHYPAVNGLKFKPTQIAELLSLPNIVGIKETTFDLFAVRQHIELTRGLDRTYLAGSELIFTQFMDIGGHGIVGTSSLIMPHTALAMYSAYSKGDKSRAKELQLQLFETMPLAKDVRAPVALVRTAFLLALRQGVDIPLDGAPTQPRLKAALARRGVPIMPIARSPLPSLTADDARVVEQVMQSIERIEPSSMNAN